MSFNFGEIGCVVEREDGTTCGGYGQPTEFEDGRILQCCHYCREKIGPVRKVRSNYPYPVTQADVHRTALDKIRRMLDFGIEPEEIESRAGSGSGPSRRDHPRYRFSCGETWVFGRKRGCIKVELGEPGEEIDGVFRIADLVREVRSGAVQASLFDGEAGAA